MNVKYFILLTIFCYSFQANASENLFQLYGTMEVDFFFSKKWIPLFMNAKDTVNWQSLTKKSFPNEGWQIKGDELILLSGRKGGDIITNKMYSNFELKLEFKMTRLVNSGVKYFVSQMQNEQNGRTEWIGYEYQIIDDFHKD